jgi:FkbM family methyltransferase
MIKPNYYGQRGDDFLLWLPFLERESKGYFVEVGALDGKRFSNTYSFEEQGWTGVCVEAHPDYIELVRQNRPKSNVIFAAAGDEIGTVTFYANSRGSLSTLNPGQEEHFKTYGVYFTGFEEHQVPMLTLTQMLAEANAPHKIDVLSIDVEGAEMLVLNGMDWSTYQAQVIIIEADGGEAEQRIDEFFARIGYHKARNYFGNVIYCRQQTDAQLIAKTEVNCIAIHTPHPLDKHEPIQHIQVVNSQPILPQREIESVSFLSRFYQKLSHYGKRLLKKVTT